MKISEYSKTCVKRPHSKRPQIGFQYQLSLNAGQKYCRMLQGEHSAILLTFIKLPVVIKIIALPIFSGRFPQVLLTVRCDKKGSLIIYTQYIANSIQVHKRYPTNVSLSQPFSSVLGAVGWSAVCDCDICISPTHSI